MGQTLKKYKVELKESVKKFMKKMDNHLVKKILEAMTSLENDPRPYGHIKMKGEESYRIRVGKYRIIYEIYETKILIFVINIDHRKDVY